METEIINKLDAACRQLNTAISLWFSGGDTVSIHTLTCSAYQIVHDIDRKQGGYDLIYDSLIVKEKHRLEANKLLKEAYNFFKHAEKDTYDTIEFKPILTEFFMMFTSRVLENLGRQPDEIRVAFNIYYLLNHQQDLTKEGKAWVDSFTKERRRYVLSMPKQQFFEFCKMPNQPSRLYDWTSLLNDY